MKFNTALAVLSGSCALWFLKDSDKTTTRSRIGYGFAFLILAIGSTTFAQYLFEINLGIDELLVTDFSNAESRLFPGRMSPIASVCFILIGASLFFIDRPINQKFNLTPLFVFPVMLICGLALLGYAYSERLLYQVGPYIRIAWPTAVCCLVLSIGTLFVHPTNSPIQVITSTGFGGMIARRLIPVVVIAPVLMGFLWLTARREEVVDRELGISLFVIAVILIFLGVVAFVARRLDFLDAQGKELSNKEQVAQKALTDNENQFRTMANSIPQLAWMADKEGWIFWYNDKWYEYTGTTFKDMEGWGWEKVHDPVELERMSVTWRNSLNTGVPWEDKFPLRSKTGEFRWFLSRALPVRNQQGEITFWLGTNTDIDAQLQIERELKESKENAENANLAKTQFLANMSHEIRTPIGAIMGFTELLKNPSNSDSDKSNFMSVIERNSQNLLRLIDDILDLSKVESGKIALEKIDFKLTDFLADVASLMNLKAAEKGIKFVLKVDGLIPEQICTDQLRLRQILTNIIGNAIKFTDTGHVEVLVKYTSAVLEIKVIDTGVGIAENSRRNLFHPFSQADPSMTRKYGGTGLGLILSKRLCNALGGDLVLAQSHVGKGSSFVITIQPTSVKSGRLVGPENLMVTAGTQKLKDDQSARLSGLRVLLVEDSADNRMLVNLVLAKEGAEVLSAVDGLDGVNQALSRHPDLVLMDIQMPVLDGHAAIRKLRSSGFSKPIIALTAHAMKEERDRCFESGCTDYLTKPIQKDVLMDLLARYVPKHS